MGSYLGGEPPTFAIGRMVMYKALCGLLWSLWGTIQDADGNPAEDFTAYAVNRLDSCRRQMAYPDFPRRLDAVRKG